MVATQQDTKARAIALLDEIPETALPEIISFLEYQRDKLHSAAAAQPEPVPVKLGGLFKGHSFSEEDIRAARREMWGSWMSDDE